VGLIALFFSAFRKILANLVQLITPHYRYQKTIVAYQSINPKKNQLGLPKLRSPWACRRANGVLEATQRVTLLWSVHASTGSARTAHSASQLIFLG